MLTTKEDNTTGSILLDAFQLYKLPLHISQDYIDPVDGHVHRFQNRCLGVSSLKSGSHFFPQVTFYEITESEISEINSLQKLMNNNGGGSGGSVGPELVSVSSPEEDGTPDSPPHHALDGLATFAATTTTNGSSSSKALPPKKRKRRRMIRYEIIFTVDKRPIHLSPEHTFFALPRNAVIECLTETAPHKLLFTFFPQSCGISQNYSQCGCHSYPPPIMEEGGSFKTKLEEFAAVCSTSCKLTLPDQSKSEGHVNNIVLSSVPHELYRAIKQMVSAYEIMCQNMMDLMKLHNEKVIHHKSEMEFLSETAISLPNQSDDDYQVSKNDEWSSSDEHSAWDKASREDEDELSPSAAATKIIHTTPPMNPVTTTTTASNKSINNNNNKPTHGRGGNNSSSQIKKCLYCGSKSTPMWRRGPQGAGTLCNACGVKWKHGKILNGSDAPEVIVPAPVNNRRGSKAEKKRKRSNASSTTGGNKRVNKKRTPSVSQENVYYDTFAVPAVPPTTTSTPQQQQPVQYWEGQSASSSTSDSRSPLESFSSSPNTSPSITTLMEQQDIKRDISSLMAYDTETLSVYVGEDAVEAAAVLTLLKRS